MNTCLNCEKETKNPKFCSRSCAAIYNNRVYIKRHKDRNYSCPVCGKKKDGRAATCVGCLKEKTYQRDQKKTLLEIRRNSAANVPWARLRGLARETLDSSGSPRVCKLCGFDIAVDACHIKPIRVFSLDSLVEEVNSLSNLVYLCPNHHIMLDRGFIDL